MKFLLNVGAEKSGTTWLYKYFKEHPDFYDMGKELNIIQRDDLVPVLEDVGEYRKDIESFFRAVSSINQVTGDFTHYEGSSENVFRLIKAGLLKYDIEVVPVYIMRDPIRRSWSAWNTLGGGKIPNRSLASRFVMSNFISCKYKETIEALDSVFANPLYFFYEDFFTQANINISVVSDRKTYVGNNYYNGNTNPDYVITGYSISGDAVISIPPFQFENFRLYQAPGSFNVFQNSIGMGLIDSYRGHRFIDFGNYLILPRIELDMKSSQMITARISFNTFVRRTF